MSIALIDADSLIYKSGFSFEDKTCWNELEVSLGIEQEPQVSWTADLLLAKNAIDATIENIKFKTGCDEIELWLSGSGNFRFDVMPSYKGNRINSRKPVEYKNLYNYLVNEYDANIATGYEADDVVVTKKTNNPLRYTLCAIDKDVLYQTVGCHYNYNKDEFVIVSEEQALRFFWYQVLTGDGVDGYKGCKGVGKVKAEKILTEAEDFDYNNLSELDYQYRVFVEKAYEEAGQTYEEFITTCRVASMHQLVMKMSGDYIQLFE